MRRAILTTIGAAVLIGAWAGPADAHPAFAGAATTENSDQGLNLNVPEERDPSVHNQVVEIRMPAGWTALGCDKPLPSWNCQIADGVITWTNGGGGGGGRSGSQGGPVDYFSFTVHTGARGTVAVPVVQTYDDSEVVRWIGPAATAEPAASIEVLPPGAVVPPTTAPPTPTTQTTSSGGPGATTTTTRGTATTTSRPAATTTTIAPAATTLAPTTTLATTTAVVDPAVAATEDVTTTTLSTPGTELASKPVKSEKSGGSNTGAVVLVLLLVVGASAGGWKFWKGRPGPSGP